MAVVVVGKKGQDVVLLNPQEKRNKFFVELTKGVKRTNSGSFKLKNKKAQKLTKEERAYRVGYIQAQNDSARAYNSKKNKKKHK